MWNALLTRDDAFDGVFVVGVETTGIFCRPSCPARKPRRDNVRFYAGARDALLAGFRPCKRCRPLEPPGSPPEWLRGLLEEIEADPGLRWSDRDLRQRGLTPDRVRRWFQVHHGMTFHAYHRARRLGLALGQISLGADVSSSAFAAGYDSLSGFNDAFRQLFGAAPTRSDDSKVVTVNRYLSPLGPMLLGVTQEQLCLMEFADRRMLETQIERLRRRLQCSMVPGSSPLLDRAAAELDAYFTGVLRVFSLPLALPGTEFQQRVWRQLMKIPFGETISYAQLASRIGQPSAVRAVARANGDNRLAIVVPCHRVIGSDGRLTGYGGGLWRKQKLLEHEQQHLA